MTFRIAQKLLQTDWYDVEASDADEALQVYEDRRGELHSNGSTSGWPFDESEEVIVLAVTSSAATEAE